MKPTVEQSEIVKASIENKMLKVNAASGTGKTSTLVLVATANPAPSLYLAFNKAMATEASGKFPSHVLCKTMHSIAFAGFGRDLMHKLNRPRGKYVNVAGTAMEVARFYNIVEIDDQYGSPAVTKAALGQLVKRTVATFEASSAASLDKKFIPYKAMEEIVEAYPEVSKKDIIDKVLPVAKRLWKDRIDLHSPVLATHDTYLKLYQLSQPKLNYSTIYLDEAQDVSDVMLDIILRQDAKMVLVGDRRQAIYCQPAGTKILTSTKDANRNFVTKSIEDVSVGDSVVSYSLSKAHLHRSGKAVSRVGVREYEGTMIKVGVDGKESHYTKDHKCVARLGEFNEEAHTVYLMRRGNQYRVGCCKYKHKSQGGMFGPPIRAAKEGADGLWLLGIYETYLEARVQEALLGLKYRLPEMCFEEPSGMTHSEVYKTFWEAFGTNEESAYTLASDLGLDLGNPLWKPSDQSMNSLKFRDVFVASAGNLVSGMQMAVFGEIPAKGKIPLECWHSIKVEKYPFTGEVFSLEVEDDHTYFGDGILTHNCWRGAVNAMEKIECPERELTQSFRYGQAVADVGTAIIGGDMLIKGFDKVDSKLDRVDTNKPYTILFRTNAALLQEAVSLLNEGKRVSAEVDSRDFIKLIDSAQALYEDNLKGVKHDSVVPYAAWNDLMDATDDEPELKRVAKIINEGMAAKFVSSLKLLEKKVDNADVILTTAHKSKGREFSQVILFSDFPAPGEKDLSVEEHNLLYVASTRAVNVLQTNEAVDMIIESYEETCRGGGQKPYHTG